MEAVREEKKEGSFFFKKKRGGDLFREKRKGDYWTVSSR